VRNPWKGGPGKGVILAPLRILHVLAPGDVGGLETVVASLASAQAEGGMSVIVVMLAEDSEGLQELRTTLEGRGVEVRTLLLKRRRYLAEQGAMGRLLDSWQPDIVHTHGYRPDVIDAPVARGRGIPTVTTVHGFTGNSLKNRFYEWLQRRAFRRFDAVVAVSSGLARKLAETGVPVTKIRTLQNAWAPVTGFFDREAARATLGLDTHGPVVGWIGRITPEKGPELMVRAFAMLEEETAILVMIGDGRERGEVRRLVADLGVEDRVLLPGIVPHASRLLRGFNVLALTSHTEGTPMVLLEAMAAGTPIVTRAVGGVPEMLSEEEAFLVHSGEHLAMARSLQFALSEPREASARAGRARRRFEEDFSVGPWVERYLEIYESVRP
jgi:glycosyltransferase involved in cell wall biosynthesis